MCLLYPSSVLKSKRTRLPAQRFARIAADRISVGGGGKLPFRLDELSWLLPSFVSHFGWRNGIGADYRNVFNGFRLVRELD
jgi:formylglycine-generating enzyme required for sulfatase activity